MSAPIDREPLRAYFTNVIGGDRSLLPGDDAPLVDEGILDSFGLAELVTFVEETYGVKVADDDVNFDKLGSIDAIAAYVEARR
ncbi:MAG: acyl carrier protein [Planctomycetota bacterium]